MSVWVDIGGGAFTFDGMTLSLAGDGWSWRGVGLPNPAWLPDTARPDWIIRDDEGRDCGCAWERLTAKGTAYLKLRLTLDGGVLWAHVFAAADGERLKVSALAESVAALAVVATG